MNAKETLNKVKAALGMEVKLEQMKLDNGTVLEADQFAPDNEVFIVSDGERVALPVGEYTLENGQMLVVQQEGIIAQINDAMPQDQAPQDANQPQMEEQAPSPKKVVESVSKEMFFAEIEKLRNEITELKKSEKQELSKEKEEEKVELKEVEIEAEKVEPKKHNPEAKTEKRGVYKFANKAPKSKLASIFEKISQN